jgi:hypothetical protein
MIRLFFSISFTLFLFTNSFISAQQVIKNDTISGTPLSITLDKRIDDLFSNTLDKCAKKNINGENYNEDTSELPKITMPEREIPISEICRKYPRISGYKIQIAVVKNNEEAREIGLSFRQKFPNMKVEIDASLRPNYRILAGSYISKQSAAGDLSKIKKYFDSAIAIQYRVFCVEAK